MRLFHNTGHGVSLKSGHDRSVYCQKFFSRDPKTPYLKVVGIFSIKAPVFALSKPLMYSQYDQILFCDEMSQVITTWNVTKVVVPCQDLK